MEIEKCRLTVLPTALPGVWASPATAGGQLRQATDSQKHRQFSPRASCGLHFSC